LERPERLAVGQRELGSVLQNHEHALGPGPETARSLRKGERSSIGVGLKILALATPVLALLRRKTFHYLT